MSDKSDWRLQGQEKYLKAVALIFKKYLKSDHDHCEFCSEKFSLTIDGALKEGYTTKDEYRWVCAKCYEDFKLLFQWK